MALKIGHGFDAHQLISLDEFQARYPNRNTNGLTIAGVCIDYPKRLAGHSDADVAIHALIDSLLGAAGLEDIGCQFPPSEKKYEAMSSLKLLKETYQLIQGEGYTVSNLDITIVAEKPKLRPFVLEMRQKIAKTLELEITQVNIKATTTEGLGFTGREEGIAAHAVCLLENL